MNENRRAAKVEARHIRTVALNEIRICANRKLIARRYVISGAYSLPEYNAILFACNRMIARANVNLRIANRALVELS